MARKSKSASSKKSTQTSKKETRAHDTRNGPPKPIGRIFAVGVGLLAVATAIGLAQSRSRESAGETVTVSPDPTAERAADLSVAVPEPLRTRIVTRHPHDRRAFTQGLLFYDGFLYESTGLEGRSSLRKIELETGEIVQRIDLEPEYFAEGLARVGNRLFQLTWRDGVAFEYDLEDFEKRGEYRYEGEGWGLCYDGEHLVMSDGSATLTFRSPEDFTVVRQLDVTKVGRPIRWLNELECVESTVYANIWQRDEIVRIDTKSGRVTGSILARGLLTGQERFGADVLNGIAYLPDEERFLITGKLWPASFEVVFEPR